MDDQQVTPQNPASSDAGQIIQTSAPVQPPDQTAPENQPISTQSPAATQSSVESTSEPVSTGAMQDQANAPYANGSPGGAGKKILLVEDDDALANVYQTRLESEGFQTQRVANGEEALQSALQYKPDLIVLDVMMPKVSGFDVLDILRNTPDTSGVKIVMLTALSQDVDKERAKSLGVNEYLVKSQVVIADVVERIKHQLGLV